MSGPLLDRFDLRLPVHRPDPTDLVIGEPGEPSAVIAERVKAVRAMARRRGVRTNAELTHRQLEHHAPLNPGAQRLLELRLRGGTLSARGLDRIRRVARTLADLAGREGAVVEEDIAIALELRAELDVLQGVAR